MRKLKFDESEILVNWRRMSCGKRATERQEHHGFCVMNRLERGGEKKKSNRLARFVIYVSVGDVEVRLE